MPGSRSTRLSLVAAAVTAVAAALLVPSTAGAAPTPPTLAGAHGPVGWDVYRQLDGMASLRPGSQVRQFSSFDRAGGNDDGFNGTYSCLRTTNKGCVIAEAVGAGELESMWFTRDYGDMTNNGKITVELDGTTVLKAPLIDVVDGRLGAPFVWPLVGNGDDTAGGSVIKVPMPYKQSMRVTVQANPLFYHVDYRTFPDATGVRTFNPAERAQDVVTRLRGFGVRDPKPAVPGAVTSTKTTDLAAGASATVASLTGSGQISQVRVKLPQVVASPRVVDDGRAFGKGGSSTFTVAVDPANQGVRLTKREDPIIGNQRATVTVDGTPVGEWTTAAPGPGGTWIDQAIELPASLTAGKSSLRIKNTFVSSDLDVNEFRYDVHSKVAGSWTRTDVLDVGPMHTGEEQAHNYRILLSTFAGSRTFRYTTDADAVAASDAVLAGAHLKITFDGEATVDAPIGEFFGSGLGEYDTRTLFSSIDSRPDGWYTAWWPMPYATGATVHLVNGSDQPISGAVVQVTSAPDASVADGLRTGRLGHFHATHHSGDTVNGADWSILDTQGSGVFYGVTQSMRGQIPAGNRREYLEGDERVYVDGVASPAWHGTGTEDFFESGWYFRDGTTYAMPLAGNPAYETDGDGCQYDCTGAVRLMAGDGVPFASALTFGIEHGPGDDKPAGYSTTAYWYGSAQQHLTETDVVDVADQASRTAHHYTAAGETTATLTSTFEGVHDTDPLTHGVTATTGTISFTAKIADGNTGMRLMRLSDQGTGYQQADVYVDNRMVGTWLQPLTNTHSRWLEDRFDVPASATAGKASVTVKLVPRKAKAAWSAGRYRVQSLG
jgi:D-arabinan exo alpha-(1,3)/(1,5)-arabinofuranosidase (non-reducing end)